MGIQNLKDALYDARTEGDLYTIARTVMILQHFGEEGALTKKEKKDLRKRLEQARAGETTLASWLPPGYVIARWLMLVKHFSPKAFKLTKKDKKLIKQAFDEYRQQGNFFQMASLKQTCDAIGVTLTTVLSHAEQLNLERELATMK